MDPEWWNQLVKGPVYSYPKVTLEEAKAMVIKWEEDANKFGVPKALSSDHNMPSTHVVDYTQGSQRILEEKKSNMKVTASKKVLGLIAEKPTVLLAKLFPGLIKEEAVHCPSCTDRLFTVSSMIQHLNDVHNWTRAQIADWVDLIDVGEQAMSMAEAIADMEEHMAFLTPAMQKMLHHFAQLLEKEARSAFGHMFQARCQWRENPKGDNMYLSIEVRNQHTGEQHGYVHSFHARVLEEMLGTSDYMGPTHAWRYWFDEMTRTIRTRVKGEFTNTWHKDNGKPYSFSDEFFSTGKPTYYLVEPPKGKFPTTY